MKYRSTRTGISSSEQDRQLLAVDVDNSYISPGSDFNDEPPRTMPADKTQISQRLSAYAKKGLYSVVLCDSFIMIYLGVASWSGMMSILGLMAWHARQVLILGNRPYEPVKVQQWAKNYTCICILFAVIFSVGMFYHWKRLSDKCKRTDSQRNILIHICCSLVVATIMLALVLGRGLEYLPQMMDFVGSTSPFNFIRGVLIVFGCVSLFCAIQGVIRDWITGSVRRAIVNLLVIAVVCLSLFATIRWGLAIAEQVGFHGYMARNIKPPTASEINKAETQAKNSEEAYQKQYEKYKPYEEGLQKADADVAELKEKILKNQKQIVDARNSLNNTESEMLRKSYQDTIDQLTNENGAIRRGELLKAEKLRNSIYLDPECQRLRNEVMRLKTHHEQLDAVYQVTKQDFKLSGQGNKELKVQFETLFPIHKNASQNVAPQNSLPNSSISNSPHVHNNPTNSVEIPN
ncbi:hypothetical protein NEHOM01_1254 [Nematocida homosporus]|uniref:uncharacterized protein n=1 Tax=Nematocida homosporus TaxID=1912981 RepID=UPI00221FBFD9|nr:uncharacterized protein NEHOM01_1254 [Nematocida homosporus]KAI5186051.1 hypothetical protein NEHOM01_1254 [Nematocida homosporus]